LLDPTFGDGGKVVTNVKNYTSQEVSSIAVQKDYKVVVTGWFRNDRRNRDFVTIRYNTDGSLDPTFSNDGIAIDSFSVKDGAGPIAIQEDGKIVLAGKTYNGTDSDFAVIRYCSDGILDSTFNNIGIVSTPIGDSDDYGSSMSIQENGKIVVAGRTYNGSDYDFSLVRYNSDGSLDHTFNNSGIVITPISSENDYVESMLIREDGKIVVAGYTTINGEFAVAVARYNTDGKLDNTFNDNGIITTSINSGIVNKVNSVVIQDDGCIFIVGQYNNSSECNYIIMKYNKNIVLDSTFNKTGIIVISNCLTCGVVSDGSIAVQNDDKIIFGGSGGKNFDFLLIRFNINGSIDNSFGDNGRILTGFENEANVIFSLNVYNNKIIAGGFSCPFDQSHFYAVLARYNVY
jgi:uncharacterized delta-60 repeat protein